MKFKPTLLALYVLVLCVSTSIAQNTYVPDDNFEQALIDLGYDSGSLNDSVPTDSISTITELNISGKGILNLTGIEAFVALNELNISNNQLSSVDLSFNNNLIVFSCYNNLLEALDFSANTIIETINCSNNNIAGLDLSLNTSLKYLNCSSNVLTLLNLKNGNNSLMTGDAYQITGIDIRNNPQLYCCQIDNIETTTYTTWFKEKWTEYTTDCSSYSVEMTYVPDDNFEQALINLGYDSESLNDSVPTSSINKVTSLYLYNKNISDLTGIESFKALTSLSCDYNKLTTLDLHLNTKLNSLSCRKNSLSSLNLNSNNLLTNVNCSYNQIIDLDLSSNTFLAQIYCYNNQLTGLNIRNGNNINLRLDARNNPNLFCIQVDDVTTAESKSWWSKNAYTAYSENCVNYKVEMTYVPDDNFEQALISMGLDSGPVNDSVPSVGLKKLTSLSISYKNITDLTGIEDFENIVTLYCENNKLSQLNLGSNTKLKTLRCYNNAIIDLDLSSSPTFTSLNAQNNKLTGLNLKNGNNSNLEINVSKNPDLLCIEVDDPEASYQNINWRKDAYTAYSEDCSNYKMEMTYIPDDNFEQALIDLGMDNGNLDDSIPVATALSVKNLNIPYRNISDLTGIEEFSALEQLSCNNNQISELNLNANTNLKSLKCQNNSIIELDLSTCSALSELDARNNQLSGLNLKNGNNSNMNINVTNNPNLLCIEVNEPETSYVYTNWSKDGYSAYSKDCSNYKLEMIYVPDDNFEQRLIELNLDFDNNLNDSVPRVSTRNLKTLHLTYAKITDLTGIESFTNLENLYCYYNKISNLDLTANISLKNLYCYNNNITNIDLSSNVQLIELHCYNNSLINLDLSSNYLLRTFDARENQLEELNLQNGNNENMSIDVRFNSNLPCINVDNEEQAYTYTNWRKNAYAGYSQDCSSYSTEMTFVPDDNFEQALINLGYDTGELNDSVPTNAISRATSLNISGAGIEDLTGIEGFVNLTKLYCDRNKLSTVNLSSNINLEQFYCSNNSLTKLDLSSVINLEYLFCEYNEMNELGLEKNTSLNYLDCANNQLDHLNLNANLKLKDIYLNNNVITKLDLSHLPDLQYLNCENNRLTELNLKNGNNQNMNLDAKNNLLFCIEVDNPNSTHFSTSRIDPWANFAEFCSNYQVDMTYVPDDNFEQAIIDLGCDFNELNDSVPTAIIETVKRLEISSKNIGDLTGLAAFKSLQVLKCGNNDISQIDLTSNIELNELQCSHNNIDELNLNSNAKLEKLVLLDIPIEKIDLSSNIKLDYLWCDNTNLRTLNLDNNTSLYRVSLSHNKLTQLSLRNGNNQKIQYFLSYDHQNLTCIEVDDPVASSNNSNWHIEQVVIFSENCGSQGAGVPLSEYNALVDLYHTTNGENWINSSKWLDTTTTSVADWYGVKVRNGHVTEITLDNNNLQESAFSETANLPYLFKLELDHNNLTGFNFDAIAKSPTLDTLILSDNKLIFEDLIPAFAIESYPSFAEQFHYEEQQKISSYEAVLAVIGKNYHLSIEVEFKSDNDELQWFKEDQKLDGETFDTLFFSPAAFIDSGAYHVEITNPDVPGLTLTSHYKIFNSVLAPPASGAGVPLSEYNALVDLYNSTNGENWTNSTKWLDTTTTSVADWYGIKVRNGHVTEITLDNNNLQESAFNETANLPYLGKLELGGNNLTGFNFEAIAKLPTLDTLMLLDNKLIFEDLIPAFAIESYPTFAEHFYYEEQQKIGYREAIIKETGTSFNIWIDFEFKSKIDLLQWFKDDVLLEGQTGDSLFVSSLSIADSGSYHYELTNPSVPDLTLKSQLKTLNPVLSPQAKGAGVPLEEYKALEALYNECGGPNWAWNVNWLDTINHTVDDWYGIIVKNNHVDMIVADSMRLEGELPIELINLSHLTDLSLGYNNISKLPEWLGDLNSLESIIIYDGNLGGQIPASIGQLKNLSYLHISGTKLEGSIPAEIGDLENLKHLSLYNNNLNGSIPEHISLLSNIETIDISNNNISGTVPVSIGNLSNLRKLDLANNNIVGPLPVELESLSNLMYFYIDGNKIGMIDTNTKSTSMNNRQIPDELAELLEIDTLYLGGNNLQFNDIEAIFAWKNFSNIKAFSYSPQNKIGVKKTIVSNEGESIVLEIDNYYPGPSDTYGWYKNDNYIAGSNKRTLNINNISELDEGDYEFVVFNSIAKDLALRSKLITLKVSQSAAGAGVAKFEYDALIDFYNKLDGNNWLRNDNWLDTTNYSVDDWYGVWVENGHVTELGFNNNNLNGAIPESIVKLNQLKRFSSTKNNIVGEISNTLITIPTLTNVNIRESNLTDSFNDIIMNSKDSLQILSLELNNIHGTIPEEIGNTNLTELWVTGNNISGSIPNSIGNLKNLFVFYASDNKLSGTIPPELGNITGIQTVILSNNQIIGPLPVELKKLVNLEDFVLDNNLIGMLNGNDSTKTVKSAKTENARQIPDELSSLISLNQLRIDNNNLMFNDVEAIFSWEKFNAINEFIYSPQETIGVGKTIEAEEETSVFLSIDNYYPGISDNYQWSKNGVPIDNGNEAELAFQNIQKDDGGVYNCVVTNTVATNLILTSKSINLVVNSKQPEAGVPQYEYLALKDFFEQFGNENWGGNWLDTLTGTVNNWSGITVENGHVVAIDLSDLNIEGDIFDIFTAFDSLTWLNLSNNQLSGIFPTFTGSKSSSNRSVKENAYNLSYLDISNNNFMFSDLEPVANELLAIDTFIYTPQQLVGSSTDTAILKYEDLNITIPDYISGINDTYTWYKDDIVAEQNDSEFVITNAQLQDSGIYILQVTNSTFPELTLSSSPHKLSVLIPVGISDFSLANVKVYPNPADKKVFIDALDKTVTLEILDITGNRVFKQSSFKSGWVNIEHYPKGIYLFRITTRDSGITTKKIVFK